MFGEFDDFKDEKERREQKEEKMGHEGVSQCGVTGLAWPTGGRRSVQLLPSSGLTAVNPLLCLKTGDMEAARMSDAPDVALAV